MKKNNDTVGICFENDKCRVNAKYDQRFKLISISREDKSMFWLWALLISLIFVIWVYCVGSFLFMFLIALFCVLVNIQLPIKKVKI